MKLGKIKRITDLRSIWPQEAVYALGERVEMRLCSDPTDRAAELYCALGYNPQPFKRYHIHTSNPPPQTNL